MQLKTTQPAVKIALRAMAVLFTFSTAACEPARPAQPAPALVSHTPQVPLDPVLAYVSMGPVGRTAVIDDPPLGGNVVVVINTQYNAASGNVCRTYATTGSSMQSQHLACNDGLRWQEVSPLISSNN